MTQNDLERQIADCAADIERFLDAHLTLEHRPARLGAAMRYGALEGGKRLRPFLVRSSAALFGVAPDKSLAAGAALELVHCYSLIHDDLPDMDNDALRRGKPSVWKAYDPALAILAGDALLSEAFMILSGPASHAQAGVRGELVGALALGARQMVEGQALDIESETRPLDEEGIYKMQALKTGALIRTGVEMGAILGGASEEIRAALTAYGAEAGLAYQIADDILDVTATSEALGKTAGKDVEQNKSTIVALVGVEMAHEILERAIARGLHALEGFGPQADVLRALIGHFGTRTR